MKKVTSVIGLVSSVAISLGWLLRFLQNGGSGNAIFAFGCLGFVALFLPMLAVDYFRNSTVKPWHNKFRIILATLSFVLIGIASLIKILHLPGADEVMLITGL